MLTHFRSAAVAGRDIPQHKSPPGTVTVAPPRTRSIYDSEEALAKKEKNLPSQSVLVPGSFYPQLYFGRQEVVRIYSSTAARQDEDEGADNHDYVYPRCGLGFAGGGEVSTPRTACCTPRTSSPRREVGRVESRTGPPRTGTPRGAEATSFAACKPRPRPADAVESEIINRSSLFTDASVEQSTLHPSATLDPEKNSASGSSAARWSCGDHSSFFDFDFTAIAQYFYQLVALAHQEDAEGDVCEKTVDAVEEAKNEHFTTANRGTCSSDHANASSDHDPKQRDDKQRYCADLIYNSCVYRTLFVEPSPGVVETSAGPLVSQEQQEQDVDDVGLILASTPEPEAASTTSEVVSGAEELQGWARLLAEEVEQQHQQPEKKKMASSSSGDEVHAGGDADHRGGGRPSPAPQEPAPPSNFRPGFGAAPRKSPNRNASSSVRSSLSASLGKLGASSSNPRAVVEKKLSESQNSNSSQMSNAGTSSSRAAWSRINGADVRPEDLRQTQILLEKQRRHLPRIQAELDGNGCKTSHWAWYAWPTDKEGFSEPSPRTKVTAETAALLFAEENKDVCKQWRDVLETICRLQENRISLKSSPGNKKPRATSAVIPQIDHGRIHFFNEFWKNCADSPQWLRDVVSRLQKYDWGHG